MDRVAFILAFVAVVGVGFLFGRSFGGRFLAGVAIVSGLSGVVLMISASMATGDWAGVVEVLFAILVWGPLSAGLAIGGAIGWGMSKKAGSAPPPMPPKE